MMKQLIAYVSRQTMKREAASVCMLWLLSMATYLIVTAQTFEQKFMVVSLFTLPIVALFGGAFTLDWTSKQTTIAGPPANTETIVKTELTDTTATTTTSSEEIKP